MPRIQTKLFGLLFLGFVVATIAGTLSHEGGHYVVARALGYNVRIAYASMQYLPTNNSREPSPRDRVLVTLAGPAQTILTGTIGWVLLRRSRRRGRAASFLPFSRWLLVFLTLFWLREPANLAMCIASRLVTGQWSGRMDELRLARTLEWPAYSIIAVAALIGSAVLADVTFREVPRAQRLTFLAAGLTGGIFGYLFWLEWVGPLLMP